MPPVAVASEFGGVLLPGRHSPVTEDEGAGPLVLLISKPHVDIAVKRTGRSNLEISRPTDPVNSICVSFPLVSPGHIRRLKHNLIFILLIVSPCNESTFSCLAHRLLLSNRLFLELLCVIVSDLLLLQLIQQLTNVPLLHVAQLITRPEHPLFGVVVDGADGEVDNLTGWLALRHCDLFVLIYFTDTGKESVLDIAGSYCVEVQESINIGRYNTVCILKEFTDHNTRWIRLIRCQSPLQFFRLMILQRSYAIFTGRCGHRQLTPQVEEVDGLAVTGHLFPQFSMFFFWIIVIIHALETIPRRG